MVRLPESVDILLMTPYYEPIDAIPRTVKSTSPGLSYVKAKLNEAGIRAKVIDPYGNQMGFDETMKWVRSFRTDIYGVSGTLKDIFGLEKLINAIKKHNPKGKTILGGFASIQYEEMLTTIPGLDYVVVGQGEGTAPPLVRAILEERYMDISRILGVAFRTATGRPYFTGRRPGITNLDELPLMDISDTPPFQLKEGGRVTVNVYSSRGCPENRCTFCTIRQVFPGYFVMSAEKFVDDLVHYLYKYPNISLVVFNDDCLDIARVPAMRREMSRRGLPEDIKFIAQTTAKNVVANQALLGDEVRGVFDRLDIGIETFAPGRLLLFDKPATPELNWEALVIVTAKDVDSFAYLILDHKLEDLEATKDRYESNVVWPKNFWMNPLVIFPHTRLEAQGYREMVQLWQRGFVKMMKAFYPQRAHLKELYTMYDKPLAAQREHAAKDPTFRQRFDLFARKSGVIKEEIDRVVAQHFEDSLVIAHRIQEGRLRADSPEVVEEAEEYFRLMNERVLRLWRYMATPEIDFSKVR